MNEVVRVACVQAESVVFDREATIDKLAALAREAAAGGAKLALFPETFVPVYPSNRWARELAHGSEGAKLWARLARESVDAAERPAGGSRPRCRHLARGRRERARTRNDLQLAARLRARRGARSASPQARSDEPRAPRLGPGRRSRARGRADRRRSRRWIDLLGEPDATRALRALRTRRGDVPGTDRGRQRGLAGLAAAHRQGVARLRALVLRVPERGELPGRRPARGGRRTARPRRLGDPRTGRHLSRRPAVGRSRDSLRGPRPGADVRRSTALRPGRPLPSPGRAVR